MKKIKDGIKKMIAGSDAFLYDPPTVRMEVVCDTISAQKFRKPSVTLKKRTDAHANHVLEIMNRRIRQNSFGLRLAAGEQGKLYVVDTRGQHVFAGFILYWKNFYKAKGHGRPSEKVAAHMNRQHDTWYAKKFGAPDVA